MRRLFVLPACLERALKNTIPEKITAECRIKPSETLKNFSKIQKEIENLRQGSKDTIGYGYQVDFIKIKDQKIGEQFFPNRIFFETKDDYQYIANVLFQAFSNSLAQHCRL